VFGRIFDMLQHEGLMSCVVVCAAASKKIFRPMMEVAARVVSESMYANTLQRLDRDVAGLEVKSEVFRCEVLFPALVAGTAGARVKDVLKGLAVTYVAPQQRVLKGVEEENLTELPLVKVEKRRKKKNQRKKKERKREEKKRKR
jgi:hypothetical protein